MYKSEKIIFYTTIEIRENYTLTTIQIRENLLYTAKQFNA